MLSYRSVPVDPPLVLAPMAGITDRQFRLILRRLGGIGLVTMEFLPADGLVRRTRCTLRLLHYEEEERPLSIQVYGSDPSRMADAARVVEDIGADVCDINMGCPANTILRGCAGCSLMGDLDLASRIIRGVRNAIRIPLTVKFRAGLCDDRLNYVELGRICEDAGVDAVALHPRTAKQMYRGQADWTRIAHLVDSLTIPVVGNGDVETPDDAVRMLRRTGCAGVMIGRASIKNPWIFRQIAELLAGRSPFAPRPEDHRELILEHFRMLVEQEHTKLVLHKMRTFTGWYTRGLPCGRDLRVQIGSLGTPEGFVDAVERFFERLRAAA